MPEVYSRHGVRFQYPEFWELTEQRQDSGIFVTVAGPETSFWSLTLFLDEPDPDHVIESAVGAFREEYDEIDVYPSDVELCERSGLSRDIEFVCLELINSAFLRAFRGNGFTALVFYQGTDFELAETRPILESICQSLELDEDEEGGSPDLLPGDWPDDSDEAE